MFRQYYFKLYQSGLLNLSTDILRNMSEVNVSNLHVTFAGGKVTMIKMHLDGCKPMCKIEDFSTLYVMNEAECVFSGDEYMLVMTPEYFW